MGVKTKVALLVGSLVAAGGMAAVASGATGAYFSDTHSGTLTGTIGTIKVTPSGGNDNSGSTSNLDFQFANMLPGDPQTATIGFQNTGANNEDVWIVFNNATALSALNNLGTYGEVHLVADGTHLFDSANLNDRSATCGAFSPSGCWPLLNEYKVASNVAPGGTGNVAFTFNYAGKLGNSANLTGGGAVWNTYPVPAGKYDPPTNTDGQTTVNLSDGSGAGLPYEIVATQVGQTP